MSAIRFRPVDYLLLCVGVRRCRCEFCGHLQWTWLLPRPLRWGLAIVLLGMVYVGSAGPVKWLHDNYRMSDTSYERLNRWVYWPLNRWVDSGHDRESKARSAFLAYREWWAPTAESLRTNDARLEPAVKETDEPVTADAPPEDAGQFADRIEHQTRRPTGEPPTQ